jgi:hypothetical protein
LAPTTNANDEQPFLGSWRIVEMELWESDDLDLVRPACVRFNRDGTGEFQFMAVQGAMDCRVARAMAGQ